MVKVEKNPTTTSILKRREYHFWTEGLGFDITQRGAPKVVLGKFEKK
jgi:hypothetical protein